MTVTGDIKVNLRAINSKDKRLVIKITKAICCCFFLCIYRLTQCYVDPLRY